MDREQLLGQYAQGGALFDVEQTEQFVEAAHPCGSNVRAGCSACFSQVECDGATIALGGFPDHNPVCHKTVNQAYRSWVRETKCTPQPVDRHARLVSEQRYGSRSRSRLRGLSLGFAEQGVDDGQSERTEDVRSSVMGHVSKIYA